MMAVSVLLLFLILHNGWAREVCPDAPQCTCRPSLVICRRSTMLPGVISRGSWPLSEAPPLYADLKESSLTATRLLHFVTMFPTLQKLDISRPNIDIPCPFIKVLEETIEGLEIVSDCIQLSRSDLGSTPSSPASSQPMDSSTTYESTGSGTSDNKTETGNLEENENGTVMIAGWGMAGALLTLLIILGCWLFSRHCRRYDLHDADPSVDATDGQKEAEAGAVVQPQQPVNYNTWPLRWKSLGRRCGMAKRRVTIQTPTAPQIEDNSTLNPSTADHSEPGPSMTTSPTSDKAKVHQVVGEDEMPEQEERRPERIYPRLDVGGDGEEAGGVEPSVESSAAKKKKAPARPPPPAYLPSPRVEKSEEEKPEEEKPEEEKPEEEKPEEEKPDDDDPPPPYADSAARQDESEALGESQASPASPLPDSQPPPVAPVLPSPSPSRSSPDWLRRKMLTPPGSVSQKTPVPRMLKRILEDEQNRVGSVERLARRQRRRSLET